MLKKTIILVFLFCLIISRSALSNITASVNTNTVGVGEELYYALTPMESPVLPDTVVNALEKDFEIIGNSYSKSFIFDINGMIDNSVLSITITPKKTGKFTIPSININGDRTNPIEITVTDQPSQQHTTSRRKRHSSQSFGNNQVFNDPFNQTDPLDLMNQLMNGSGVNSYRQQRPTKTGYSGKNSVNTTNGQSNSSGRHTTSIHPENDDIFVKSFVDKNNPYKGEQVIYTTRAYFLNRPSREATIDPPNAVHSQFDTVKANNIRQGQENINGILYYTYDTDSAIFPTTSGEINIPPPSVSVISRSLASVFTRGLPFASPRKQSYSGESIKITAKNPLPGDHWLPAKDITITEDISPRKDKYKIGDNITRTITIQAKGQLARNLPGISKTDSKQYNIYQGKEDRIDNYDNMNIYGVLGTYSTEFTIIPLESGEIKLPDYEITYFNTDQNKFITVKSKPGKISVTEGNTRNEKIVSDINETTDDVSEEKNNDNEKNIVTLKETYEQVKNLILKYAYHIAVATAAIFVLLILKIMVKKRKGNDAAQIDTVSHDNDYKRELKDAIAAKDPSRAKFAAVRLYNHEFGTHYSTIESVSSNLKYIQFSAEVDILNAALYSKNGNQTWNRKEFYDTLITGIKNKKEEIAHKPTVPNLYPF